MAKRREIGWPAAFLRLALLCVVVAAGALAVGYYPTRALAGRDGVIAMCVGMGIALVAALAGLVPAVLTFRLGPGQRLNGMLAGMAIRFVLMLGLLVAVLLSGLTDQLALAVWAVIGYMVLLAADTAGVVWLSNRTARASS